jgi:2-iminobutanoate/2-iminopropanoate deaminase
LGPYVQAVRAGDFLFISGQLPVDPLTNTLVRAGVKAQTRRALENVKTILESVGAGLPHVVRLTVYLRSLDETANMNEICAELFQQHLPARMVMEVARLPKEALVAVDAIAYLGS